MLAEILIKIQFYIAFGFAKMATRKLGSWILSRIYSIDQLHKDISINCTRDTIINMMILANVNLPVCNFSLTISNNSPFEITLDGISVELWLDQRLCDKMVNERVHIKSRAIENIAVSVLLNELQVKAVKRLKRALPKIVGMAYFETPLGDINIQIKHENIAMTDNFQD